MASSDIQSTALNLDLSQFHWSTRTQYFVYYALDPPFRSMMDLSPTDALRYHLLYGRSTSSFETVMRYFELTDDVEIPQRWHLSAVTTPEGSEPALRTGKVVTPTPLSASISHAGRPLAFCLTSFAIPIVEHRAARAFERLAAGDIQCLPVVIPGHAGFEVLNVIRVVKCLDESRSEFTKWTTQDHRADLAGQYRMVTRLRLDPKAIPPGVHAFRVQGWLIALIVSEDVKGAMETSGCFGAKFSDVE